MTMAETASLRKFARVCQSLLTSAIFCLAKVLWQTQATFSNLRQTLATCALPRQTMAERLTFSLTVEHPTMACPYLVQDSTLTFASPPLLHAYTHAETLTTELAKGCHGLPRQSTMADLSKLWQTLAKLC